MTRSLLGLLLLAVLASPAGAQGVPRIKGKVVDFDGLTFHLATADGKAPLAIRLQAHTEFMTNGKASLAAIKVGAYVGATVQLEDGTLIAREVQLYPPGLRGSSEGRIALSPDRFVITGAVTAASAGTITLFYRGARQDGAVCLGRADPKAPSPVCSADAIIRVPASTPVLQLTAADRRLLVPGAVATVSVETDAKGQRSTPGLLLEKPQTSP